MKKIMVVFGTRPEAIKLCPLVLKMKEHDDLFEVKVCVTAQHREMLDQVLDIFSIVPDYDLDLMKHNQSIVESVSSCLNAIDKVISKDKPDIIVVQGDTTTTFSASLAAFYNKIILAHVEAGLRTNNKYSPFPEEINRKLTTAMADIHFVPTNSNKINLLHENVDQQDIVITGNTVIDALLWVKNNIINNKKVYDDLNEIDFTKKVILVTGHRRESFGPGFENVCNALKHIASNNNDVELVYPVHLNPNVQKPVYDILKGVPNIKLIKPLSYEPFVHLMDKSYFIITDSGGIQEEAPSLGKPVLVTRDTTERPEAVDIGIVQLVGTNKDIIISQASKLLNDKNYYNKISSKENPYGDGHACQKIVQSLINYDI